MPTREIHNGKRWTKASLDLEDGASAVWDGSSGTCLKSNGIGFVHFTCGEPLVRPDFTAMVADAAQTGMITTLVTNGALLTQKRVDALAEGGLASVYISIDAASYKVHDSNRGLPGLSARIRRANAALKRHQIPSSATIR